MRIPAITERPGLGSEAFDEAFTSDGVPRPHYAEVIEQLQAGGPGAVARAMTRAAAHAGLSLGTGAQRSTLPVDPVPRIFTASEWRVLADGLVQRARMLEALAGDCYGERRAIRAGALPEEVVASSVYLERDLIGTPLRGPALGIIGFDVVRRPDGVLAVLEDNLLTPGHAAVSGLRGMAPLALPDRLVDVHAATTRLLGSMLATGGGGESVAILSDEPLPAASWELRRLAAMLGVPVLGYDEVRVSGGRLVTAGGRPLDLVWQRTSEDRLRADDGTLTPLGERLLVPLLSGTLRVVNRIGCGVADDKRVFAHTPRIARALLGEPLTTPIVECHDLADPAGREAALADAAGLVFKPRNGAGGRGVSMPPHDSAALRSLIEDPPGQLVAQRLVDLSRHPTVSGDALTRRRVDLRVFAVRGEQGWEVIPGGVSRYPARDDGLIVNTSGGGGVKDAWVLQAG